MTDEDVLNLVLVGKSKRLTRNLDKLLNENTELSEYIAARFSDSSSVLETIHRLRFGIYVRPVCKKCGGYVPFNGQKDEVHGMGFDIYCCKECKISGSLEQQSINYKESTGYSNPLSNPVVRDKIKQTCLSKYGYENVGQSPEIKEKIRQTNLDRRGVACPFQDEEVKAKCIATWNDNYGVVNPSKSEVIQEQIRHTIQVNLGVEHPFESAEVRAKSIETWKINYGVHITNPAQAEEVKAKIRESWKQNGSYGKSKTEDMIYELLCAKFDVVKRQYRSEVYPFNCDFYIPSIDTYIEYQGFCTHNRRPYTDSDNDKLEAQNFLKLSIAHPLYKAIHDVWTIGDVKKRTIAKENNLNYVELWSLEDAKKYISRMEIN